ncbi:MAG: ABC transporter ATP-binding protein [Spirochaetales bacterium]|nr:ABC transporter ATP-binding protein [Spirochaetales bacterium]
MPKIVLEHVTKRFNKFTAVEDLNMVIEDREFIILLGPSGCGKTTTLRMIAGLETPTEGRITIGDTVVFDSEKRINLSPAKRDIGFLFQNYALWPHMTVHQNIAFGLENLKWPKPQIEERVKEMLEMLKIEEFDKRYPSELSGGQQQRVAIARTLAPRPKVLFMDEPLSNLDAKLRLEMRIELKRLHTDTDSTFVYVTHDQLEAMTLSSRICLIKTGFLQQFDPPMETYSNPANLFVADFVGNPSMNFIPAKAKITGEKTAEVSFFGKNFLFTSEAPLGELKGEAVIGIRPEFIHLEKGSMKGKVYGTLPAGMETTVKLIIDDYILTSVKFGNVDYKLHSEMNYSIEGNGIILFDKESTMNIGKGTLTLA